MTTVTNQQVDQERINGLDKGALFGTVAAIKDDPGLGRFEFRAKNQWISGGENRSTIKEFYGARSEDSSRAEPFSFTNGEPPVLLGHNEGANPVEFLLHALAGCVTTTAVIHAGGTRHHHPPALHRTRWRPRRPGLPGPRRLRAGGLPGDYDPHAPRGRLQ